MAGAVITGVVGRIKWGYYIAADVNGYTVTRSQDQVWNVRGVVVNADAYKMAQRPLMFVAPHNQGDWRWPIQDIQIVAGTLTARLGSPLPDQGAVIMDRIHGVSA